MNCKPWKNVYFLYESLMFHNQFMHFCNLMLKPLDDVYIITLDTKLRQEAQDLTLIDWFRDKQSCKKKIYHKKLWNTSLHVKSKTNMLAFIWISASRYFDDQASGKVSRMKVVQYFCLPQLHNLDQLMKGNNWNKITHETTRH